MAEISNTPYPDSGVMSPTQATQIVQSAGIDPNAVLSGANVASTIAAPVPAPDDLLGIRKQIYGDTGVDTAWTEYQAKNAAVTGATNQLNTNLQQLSNRAVSMNKITGQQAQLREVAGNEIEALTGAAKLAFENWTAKKSEADSQFEIREAEVGQKRALQAQYPGAKIGVGDSFDVAIGKIAKWGEKQEKDAQKDALKEIAMGLGLKTSGSRKELRSRISKANKEALAKADELAALKIEQIKADIANTRSTIANRGGSGDKPGVISTGGLEKDADGNVYNVVRNKNTGDIISMEPFTGGTEEDKGGFWNTAGKVGATVLGTAGMTLASGAEQAKNVVTGTNTNWAGETYKAGFDWIWD